MYPNQELTTHLNEHTALVENCDFCTSIQENKEREQELDAMYDFSQIYNDHKDNMFSANHRTNMLAKYGYTIACTVQIKDLI